MAGDDAGASAQAAYAERHGLVPLMELLLNHVLIRRPTRPLESLANEARRVAAESGTRAPPPPPPREATCTVDLGLYELHHGLAERFAALMSAALLAQPPELAPFIAAEAARMQAEADAGRM